jgi:hypothetical protein
MQTYFTRWIHTCWRTLFHYHSQLEVFSVCGTQWIPLKVPCSIQFCMCRFKVLSVWHWKQSSYFMDFTSKRTIYTRFPISSFLTMGCSYTSVLKSATNKLQIYLFEQNSQILTTMTHFLYNFTIVPLSNTTSLHPSGFLPEVSHTAVPEDARYDAMQLQECFPTFWGTSFLQNIKNRSPCDIASYPSKPCMLTFFTQSDWQATKHSKIFQFFCVILVISSWY